MGTNTLQVEYEASQCSITSLQEELDDMRFLNSSLVNEERDNVVYWKTKRKINDDLQCN